MFDLHAKRDLIVSMEGVNVLCVPSSYLQTLVFQPALLRKSSICFTASSTVFLNVGLLALSCNECNDLTCSHAVFQCSVGAQYDKH